MNNLQKETRWVISHVSMSHVTYVWMIPYKRDESCYRDRRLRGVLVILHAQDEMSQVAHMRKHPVTRTWTIHVMHVWMYHVKRMNTSCHKYKQVMSPTLPKFSGLFCIRALQKQGSFAKKGLKTLEFREGTRDLQPSSHLKSWRSLYRDTLQHTALHCNTCNTLQHTAEHCSAHQHTATYSSRSLCRSLLGACLQKKLHHLGIGNVFCVAHVNGACRTCKWITSHVRRSHVMHTKDIRFRIGEQRIRISPCEFSASSHFIQDLYHKSCVMYKKCKCDQRCKNVFFSHWLFHRSCVRHDSLCLTLHKQDQ